MQQHQFEPLLLKYLIDDNHVYNLVKSSYFGNADCQTIFKYHTQYRTVFEGDKPSSVQLHEYIKSHGVKGIEQSKINIIYDTDISNETGFGVLWAKDQVENWIRIKNLEHRMTTAVMYMNSVDVDSENSLQVFNTVNGILVQGQNLSFNFESGLDFFDVGTHTTEQAEYFSTGYDFLDTTIGGWSEKTLHVFTGPPKVGKTLTLGNIASKSVMSGNNTYIITLELAESKYAKRLGSDLMNIKINDYTNVTSLPNFKDILLEASRRYSNRGQLFIKEFPTSTLTVPQLEAHLLQEEEKKEIKFKTIVIDYLNLMSNHRNPNTENTYMKIKQIAEDLRAMAQRNDWCIITATQTKRENYGADDINMTDVAESAGLIHTVDSLVGIIQPRSLKVLNQYEWKILCNRDGGYVNSKKLILVDYNYMRLTECPNSMIIEDDGFY